MNELIEKQAIRFREQNGISASDAINLRSLILKTGVNTIFLCLSENFSGMAIKGEGYRFMLINSAQSIGRQHFTIAHELYHLFVQQGFDSMTCSTGLFNRKNIIEYQADLFAAYLLLPENGIMNMVPDEELSIKNVSLPTVVKLEQYFGVSRKAMLRRLDELDLIRKPQFEAFSALGVKQSAAQLGYDVSLYQPGNENLVIGDYGEKARRLFDKQIISESHYLSLMNLIGANLNVEENG